MAATIRNLAVRTLADHTPAVYTKDTQIHIFKSSSQLVLGAALSLLGLTNALAEYEPNDNYSTLVLSYQSSKFAEPACITTGSGIECHEGVAGPAAIYARQIIPNLALGVAGSYLQSSGNASSIKSTNGSVFVQGIAGLGSSVDVGASVAALRTTLELCISNPSVCASSSDSGTDVGIFGKVFLNKEKSVSATLSYNYIKLSEIGEPVDHCTLPGDGSGKTPSPGFIC